LLVLLPGYILPNQARIPWDWQSSAWASLSGLGAVRLDIGWLIDKNTGGGLRLASIN
jgi:hypothetical protein